MVKRWTKIFHYGDMYTADIFDGRVQITEKLDGSQINWGLVEGRLVVKSKGTDLNLDNVPDLFKPAVDHLKGITHLLAPGYSYHGETLCRPKHNILQYKRVPTNYIALYGVVDEEGRHIDDISGLRRIADSLGIEAVQEFFAGRITGNGLEYLDKFIAGESQLGGPIEGVVVKNFTKKIKHGTDEVLAQAKYVSNDFKERAQRPVKILKTRDPIVDRLAALVRTEARYLKAVQR